MAHILTNMCTPGMSRDTYVQLLDDVDWLHLPALRGPVAA